MDPATILLLMQMAAVGGAIAALPTKGPRFTESTGTAPSLLWYPSQIKIASTAGKLPIQGRALSSVDETVEWVRMANDKIDSLCGHNSMLESEPPNEVSLHNARLAIGILASMNMQPTNIIASAEGGLGIFFVAGTKYADIEFLNTGEIIAMTKDAAVGRREVWDVDAADMAEDARLIESFIRG